MIPEERVRELMDYAVGRQVEIQQGYIEMLCGAYLATTDIPPAEVELVEDRRGSETVWYFRRRSGIKQEAQDE